MDTENIAKIEFIANWENGNASQSQSAQEHQNSSDINYQVRVLYVANYR